MNELDGIWDWAEKLGLAIHRKAKIQELEDSIQALQPDCGTCCHWMKSSECPRERNVNGRRFGPSMNDPKCELHQEQRWVTELREKRRQEIANIRLAGIAEGKEKK